MHWWLSQRIDESLQECTKQRGLIKSTEGKLPLPFAGYQANRAKVLYNASQSSGYVLVTGHIWLDVHSLVVEFDGTFCHDSRFAFFAFIVGSGLS